MTHGTVIQCIDGDGRPWIIIIIIIIIISSSSSSSSSSSRSIHEVVLLNTLKVQ